MNDKNFINESFNKYVKAIKPKLRKSEKEVEINGTKYQLATLNRRLIAGTIDCIILSIVMTCISYILISFLPSHDVINQLMSDSRLVSDKEDVTNIVNKADAAGILISYLLIQFFVMTLSAAYFVISWKKYGCTIGKFIMKCKIIDATTGKNITIKQGIGRVLSYILSIITLFIGVFMIDMTAKSQGLHDKIANTLVIRNK